MEVKIEEATDDPEMRVIRAARNDYKPDWVGDEMYAQTLSETVDEEERIELQNGVVVARQPDKAISDFVEGLLKKGHFGPFEHPQVTYAIKGVSRSLMAQITRHRTGITFDIQSQRYVDFQGSDAADLIVTPASVEDVNAANRSPDARSLDDVFEDYFDRDELEVDYTKEEWIQRERQLLFQEAIEHSVQSYNDLRDLGVPPEDARFVLPIGSKVNIYVTLNARTLMHIADMRAQADAQWEVAELSDKMLDLAEEWMPHSFGFYRSEMIHRKNRLAP